MPYYQKLKLSCTEINLGGLNVTPRENWNEWLKMYIKEKFRSVDKGANNLSIVLDHG